MAGTTPTYGLRYPELVDPPDGAALGKNLADDVEAQLERIDAENASQQAELDAFDLVEDVTVADANVTYGARSVTRVGRVVELSLECTVNIGWPAYSWPLTVVPVGFRPRTSLELLFTDPNGSGVWPAILETDGTVVMRKLVPDETTLLLTATWISA